MAKVILPRTNIVRGFIPNHQPAPRATVSLVPAPVALREHCERILLLEDEAQTNFILREYLESLGYQVVAVPNGVDGLKEVIKSDFELVICDMMMPKLPGDMFYLAVQKTRPELCSRFVFITGHQENPTVDAFIQKTNSAILVKPFRLKQLEETLENILSKFPKKQETIPAPAVPPAPIALKLETPREELSASSPLPVIRPEKTSISMVTKALQMVGLRRTPTPVLPAQHPAAEPQQIPRVTPDYAKVTRRIAHLANAPVITSPVNTPPPRSTRRIAAPKTAIPQTPAKPVPQVAETKAPIIRIPRAAEPTVAKPRVTQKIASPIRVAAPKAKPKVATPVTKTKVAVKPVVKAPVKPSVKAVTKVPAKILMAQPVKTVTTKSPAKIAAKSPVKSPVKASTSPAKKSSRK